MNTQLAWHVARASGLVAWALCAAALLWGFALSSRVLDRRRVPPAWLADLHRGLGGLAVIFTVVHVVALLVDDYVGFGPVDVLVPLASGWHPVPVAWGVVAFYLLLAVELSSLYRRRLRPVWWRRLHLLSLPLFMLATLHLVSAGSDAHHVLVRVFVWSAVAAVVYLGVVRVLVRRPRRPAGRPRRASARG